MVKGRLKPLLSGKLNAVLVIFRAQPSGAHLDLAE